MLSSFKTKLTLLIVFMMSVITIGTIYFIRRDITDIMVKTEKAAVQNALNFAELVILGGYENLLQDKFNIVVVNKRQLRRIAEFCVSVLEQHAAITGKPHISVQEVRNMLADLVKSESTANQLELFIFDFKGDILFHPNPLYQGISISSLKDVKGIPLTEVMGSTDDLLENKGKHVVFYWQRPGQEKENKYLAYVMPFSNWDWIIGTMINLSLLETESEQKFQKVIENLEKVLSQIHISKTGAVFVFSGEGKSIIQPAGRTKDYHRLVNHQTGNSLFQDMIETVKSNASLIQYKLDGENVMYAHIRYFKVLDWYIAAEISAQELVEPAKNLVFRQIFIITVIFFSSLPIIFFLVKRFTSPLKVLASYAEEIPSQDLTTTTEEDNPIDQFPVRYRDEIGRLAESFLKMKAELKNSIRSMIEAAKATERIENELNVARKIQLGFIPQCEKTNNIRELELYAVLEPAKEVGGDLYDFFLIDDNHLCFTIGDVSGKGIPAAMFMVITRTLVKVLAENVCFESNSCNDPLRENFNKTSGLQRLRSPSEILYQINNILSSDNPNNMFVTMIVGMIHLPTGRITWANGGHNPPVMIPDHEKPYYLHLNGGAVVGFMEKMKFPESTLLLNPGDAVLFYTDGVNEAMNPEGDMFSTERLLNELEPFQHQPAQNTGAGLYEKIKEFRGTAPQSDDIAMLVIRYLGN
jgi:sigma-B regulation protein RsbU (phosphoserine phosphatase)